MERREARRLPNWRRPTQEWRAYGAPSPFAREGAELNMPRGESAARENENGCLKSKSENKKPPLACAREGFRSSRPPVHPWSVAVWIGGALPRRFGQAACRFSAASLPFFGLRTTSKVSF